MRVLVSIATIAIVLSAPVCGAEHEIVASALFDGRAMLSIDGQPRVLRVGQVSPEGVRLVSASAQEAVIEVQGQRRTILLGRDPVGGFVPPDRRQVSVPRNDNGQYRVGGSINGHAVLFMVDTGANVVALSGAEASRLGIDYRKDGMLRRVTTAGGVLAGWEISLDRVELAGIVVRNVRASVLDGDQPAPALLGMSFLSRVSLREDAGVMYLQER